jgi:hypothetical protein
MLLFPFVANAQNVGIGTTTPQSRLEVKDTIKSQLLISSKFFEDTTQLIFKNRNADNLGTDIILSSNREQGLRFTSKSDLTGNVNDSILQLTPQGAVGINNTRPQEKLDVRGNINVTGIIKANGIDGTANQVLMKNGSGNLAWGDMCEFKNRATFTTGTSCAVLDGVNRVQVELWGGGGGGNHFMGGGVGGFISAILFVTPQGMINYTIATTGSGARVL